MLRATPHSILLLFTRTLLPLLLLCAVLGTPVVAPAGEPAAKQTAVVPQGKTGVLLVAFGTSVPEALVAMKAVDEEFKAAFSGQPVVWAGPLGYRDMGLYQNFWRIVEHYRLAAMSAVPS